MQWEEIFDKTKLAFEKGEMFELLKGDANYSLAVCQGNIDVPTDWTSLISHGIFELYRKEQDARLIEDYERAIRDLISGNALEIWTAANVICCHLMREAEGKAAFEIDKGIAEALSQSVLANKDALASDKSYQGCGKEFGLLDDILRLDNILSGEFNRKLIQCD